MNIEYAQLCTAIYLFKKQWAKGNKGFFYRQLNTYFWEPDKTYRCRLTFNANSIVYLFQAFDKYDPYCKMSESDYIPSEKKEVGWNKASWYEVTFKKNEATIKVYSERYDWGSDDDYVVDSTVVVYSGSSGNPPQFMSHNLEYRKARYFDTIKGEIIEGTLNDTEVDRHLQRVIETLKPLFLSEVGDTLIKLQRQAVFVQPTFVKQRNIAAFFSVTQAAVDATKSTEDQQSNKGLQSMAEGAVAVLFPSLIAPLAGLEILPEDMKKFKKLLKHPSPEINICTDAVSYCSVM